MEVPEKYTYSLDDFTTAAPYEFIYNNYFGAPFTYQAERVKLADNAKNVGFKGFHSMMKAYEDTMHKDNSMVLNQTDFTDQPAILKSGAWDASDIGIFKTDSSGNRILACAHPIMPVKRLINIDTGEVKIELAFKRSAHEKSWHTIIVGKDVISTSRTIVSLSSQGISVTSTTASALVDYLNDIENLNYDLIPERKSIGRLGYIQGEGFSPYVDGLVFDGDANFRHLYSSVKASGSETEWFRTALECRKMSVTARIMLAASFASPLLSIVGCLPFFVHLWGVDSGTGKTVALMLAASVWGSPSLGEYTQTFNSTQVGQERTAAFLNHLPLCIDELQLTKDGRGRSAFDVYQLAQGVGRSRGKRNGGVEMVPTWSCCFLTTGESPLTSESSGAGAVNRVIDIECTAGAAVVTDGQRISGKLRENYGWAGMDFVKKLYEDGAAEVIREIYQENFHNLCNGESTEKQAMAAAAIITADQLAEMWIFKDGTVLTSDDMQKYLATKESVSAGYRAYRWLCDWVAANSNKFFCESNDFPPSGEIYGSIDGNIAKIIRAVFTDALTGAGFSERAVLSYLRSAGKIECGEKGFAKSTRIGKSIPQCVWLKIKEDHTTPVCQLLVD